MKDFPVIVIQDEGNEDSSLRNVVRKMFSGHDIKFFSDLIKGFQHIKNKPQSCLFVSDAIVNGLDAVRFLIKIRSMPVFRGLYFIIMNNTGKPDANLKALKADVDDIIMKPASIDRYILRFRTASKILNLKSDSMDKTISVQLLMKKLDEDAERELKLLKMFQKSKLPEFYKYMPQILEAVQFIARFYNEDSKPDKDLLIKAAEFSFSGRMKLPGAIKYQTVYEHGMIRGDEFRQIPHQAKRFFDEIHGAEDIGNILFQVYENWDGTGIPKKLRANQIALEARIIRVVTDYCEFYRRFNKKEQLAREELFNNSKKLYDFKIVALLDQYLAYLSSRKKPAPEKRIELFALDPGMVLTRSIISECGNTLIGAGAKLDEKSIDRLIAMSNKEKIIGHIYIKK